MALCCFLARRNHSSRHRNAGSLEYRLGDFLLHCERGREHARMRIWNAENLEHALQRSVFARTSMQHIECNIGLERAQRCGDIGDLRRPG